MNSTHSSAHRFFPAPPEPVKPVSWLWLLAVPHVCLYISCTHTPSLHPLPSHPCLPVRSPPGTVNEPSMCLPSVLSPLPHGVTCPLHPLVLIINSDVHVYSIFPTYVLVPRFPSSSFFIISSSCTCRSAVPDRIILTNNPLFTLLFLVIMHSCRSLPIKGS